MLKRMMIGIFVYVLFIVACLFFYGAFDAGLPSFLSGIAFFGASGNERLQTEKTGDISAYRIQDSPGIYAGLDADSVLCFFVKIPAEPGAEAGFADLNNWEGEDEAFSLPCLIREGDENGVLTRDGLGYGDTGANAAISLRAASGTRFRNQKSYSVSLNARTGLWNGMKTLALNKHVYDSTRVKNKLVFDMLQTVPDIPGCRTWFVRLYIMDETKAEPDTAYVDYGLYTMVETINKTYLRNHGLDSEGNLYKAVNFSFSTDEALRPASDPDYDADAFNAILESKGGDNHNKLLSMIADVNNWDKPIDETIDKYFEVNNYTAWLAMNILLGNRAAPTENFYLYSPTNSSKFYFLPWDFDNVLMAGEDSLNNTVRADWESGIANYWKSVLHRRFLSSEENRLLLDKKIEEMYLLFSTETIAERMELYRPVIESHSLRMPDLMHLRNTKEKWEVIWNGLPDAVQINYDRYKQSLNTPTPFGVNTPEAKAGKLYLSWEESLSFLGDGDVRYDILLAQDMTFERMAGYQMNVSANEAEWKMPEPGAYYLKITAKDGIGAERLSYDMHENVDGIVAYGVKKFYVLRDGTVEGVD